MGRWEAPRAAAEGRDPEGGSPGPDSSNAAVPVGGARVSQHGGQSGSDPARGRTAVTGAQRWQLLGATEPPPKTVTTVKFKLRMFYQKNKKKKEGSLP